MEAKIDLVPERSVILNGRKGALPAGQLSRSKCCNAVIPLPAIGLAPPMTLKGWKRTLALRIYVLSEEVD